MMGMGSCFEIQIFPLLSDGMWHYNEQTGVLEYAIYTYVGAEQSYPVVHGHWSFGLNGTGSSGVEWVGEWVGRFNYSLSRCGHVRSEGC